MYIVCKIPPITQYGHIMVRKEFFFNFNGMLGLWEEEKMIPAQDYKNWRKNARRIKYLVS